VHNTFSVKLRDSVPN